MHEGRLERWPPVHQFRPADLLLSDHSDGPLFACSFSALGVSFLENEFAPWAERNTSSGGAGGFSPFLEVGDGSQNPRFLAQEGPIFAGAQSSVCGFLGRLACRKQAANVIMNGLRLMGLWHRTSLAQLFGALNCTRYRSS